jgi:hypothetical protein
MRMRHPSPAARAIRNNPAPTTTPMARATRSPAGARRSTVMAAATTAITRSVSRASLAKINAYKKRMGWSFPWVSSYGSDFNFDYHVSWTPEQLRAGKGTYNFQDWPVSVSDDQGISVFYKNERDEVFHTYSCYSRVFDPRPAGQPGKELVFSC